MPTPEELFEIAKQVYDSTMPAPDVWHYVPSSNVVGFMYHKSEFMGAGNDLFIRFKWGAEYQYSNVDDATIKGLDSASSPGGYVNESIKNRFNYTRVL